MVPKCNLMTPCLVIDVSHLNGFIDPYWFLMLMVAHVHLVLCPGAWFIAVDQESAFGMY